MRCVRGAASRSFLPLHSVQLSGHQQAMQNRAEPEHNGSARCEECGRLGRRRRPHGQRLTAAAQCPSAVHSHCRVMRKHWAHPSVARCRVTRILCVQASRGQDAKSQQQQAILRRLRQYPATPAAPPYSHPTLPTLIRLLAPLLRQAPLHSSKRLRVLIIAAVLRHCLQLLGGRSKTRTACVL